MKLATWNINSVRLRINLLKKFLKLYDIDVLCLQETKTEDEFFPVNDLLNLGYPYLYFRGEKSYNGVAIISKIPFISKNFQNFCKLSDSRHISVTLKNKVTIHNFYVPAGGDVPNSELNKKFEHKLKFLNEITNYLKKESSNNKVVMGDLNIAPLKNDVWSHRQLLNVVSHTKVETDKLLKLLSYCDLIDIIRYKFQENKKVFSWWSYRNKDWKKTNRGRRLDHIFVSRKLVKYSEEVAIYKEIRDWNKPSDHVPILLNLKL